MVNRQEEGCVPSGLPVFLLLQQVAQRVVSTSIEKALLQ